ncbi:hypothetical protein, partial [Streptococcus pneumoniae]|uniref:hypothetical protein n=1 Tax=Streptococcus pneumoniae TaxID=1313 RepID=UPI001CB79975
EEEGLKGLVRAVNLVNEENGPPQGQGLEDGPFEEELLPVDLGLKPRRKASKASSVRSISSMRRTALPKARAWRMGLL